MLDTGEAVKHFIDELDSPFPILPIYQPLIQHIIPVNPENFVIFLNFFVFFIVIEKILSTFDGNF
jgi:hypothetical protein